MSFGLCIFFSPQDSHAAEKELFTVRNLTIEKKMGEKSGASTLKEARALALSEGRELAYRRLLETLIPDEEVESLLLLSGDDIQILVRDVEIKQEVANKDFYRVTTHWHFEPDLVVSLLKQSNKPYLSRAPFEMLLVALLRGGVDVMGHNPWSEAWRRFDHSSGIISYELYDAKRALLPLNWQELFEREVANYKGGILLAVAEIIFDEGGKADAAILKSLAFEENGRANHILSDVLLNVTRQKKESEQAFYDRAVAVFYRTIANRWKRSYRIDHLSRIIPIRADVHYDGLKEWLNLRKNLSSIPVIDDFAVESFGHDGAEVSFNVVTALEDFRLHLRGIGLSLEREGEGGEWLITNVSGKSTQRQKKARRVFEGEFLSSEERKAIYAAARKFKQRDDKRWHDLTKQGLSKNLKQSQKKEDETKIIDDLWSSVFGKSEEEEEEFSQPTNPPDRIPPLFLDL